MPEIITRAEAEARGLKRYFTGELCTRGHLSERYTKNWGCCECRGEAYQRFFSEPEKRRRYERDKYVKQRARRMEYMRRYYEKNAETIRARVNNKNRKIADMIDVLKQEMPDLLKEFGL